MKEYLPALESVHNAINANANELCDTQGVSCFEQDFSVFVSLSTLIKVIGQIMFFIRGLMYLIWELRDNAIGSCAECDHFSEEQPIT